MATCMSDGTRVALVTAAIAMALLAIAPRARAEVVRPVGEETLADAVTRAHEGDVVEIPPGIWAGPLRIERAITLRGAGGIVDGGARGTVITVLARGVRLEGVEARSSGADLGASDSCVWTAPSAEGVVIAGGRFTDCAFGIYVQESDHARIEGNEVVGRAGVREADRGNGIHLFDASFVTVVGNTVTGARDGFFVSATDDSLIEGNRAIHVRYGVHYMWSHRNVLRGNVVQDSLTGFALMQSRDLVVEGNLALRNRRVGMLLRDGEGSRFIGNRLIGNGQGFFVYNSQRERLEDNLVLHNDIGAKIWGAMVMEGVFAGNAFVGNARQVLYIGSRDLVWGESERGNHYSDYVGWDQNDDGVGDRPYRVDGLTAALIERHPSAVLLLRSPTLELLTHLESRVPLLRTATVIDRAPLVRPSMSIGEARDLEAAAPEAPRVAARDDHDGTSME